MDLRGALADVVGERHVLADADLRASYERDWTGRFGGEARLVVRPADTGQVAAIVRACAEAGAPIVPQGGNTGLVGGGVPRGGEGVRSLARLDARVTALIGVDDIPAAAELLARLRAHAPSLESCEFFLDEGLELVLAHQRRSSPLPRAPVYVLAECAARNEPPVAELAAAGLE